MTKQLHINGLCAWYDYTRWIEVGIPRCRRQSSVHLFCLVLYSSIIAIAQIGTRPQSTTNIGNKPIIGGHIVDILTPRR